MCGGFRTNYPLQQRYYDDLPLVLPYRLQFPGFAINTLFYAAALWLLIHGSFELRHIIRRKRGLCMKCKYDLRGTELEVCPECGISIVKANPS